ncbi:MAG: hypothetical protein ACK4OO_02015 [bacterium]
MITIGDGKHLISFSMLLWVLLNGTPSLGVPSGDKPFRITVTIKGNQVAAPSLPLGRVNQFSRPEEVGQFLDTLFDQIKELGYPLAQVRSVREKFTPSGVNTDIVLDAGLPAYAEITCSLSGVGKANVKVSIVPLTRNSLEEWAREIVKPYVEQGFLTTKILLEVEEIRLSADTLWVRLGGKVERGPYLRLESLSFPRVYRTRWSFLEKVTGLKRGEELRASRLEKAQSRLYRLPFVSGGEEFRLYPASPGLAKVAFPLQETSTSRIEGDLFGSSNTPLAGELKLQFVNISGTGRSASFFWWSGGEKRYRSHLQYEEPFVLNSPLSLEVAFQTRSEPLYGRENGGGLGLKGEVRESLQAKGMVRQVSTFRQDQGFSTKTLWTEGELALHEVEPPRAPRSGESLTLRISRGYRSSSSLPKSLSIGKEEWSGRFYHQITRSFTGVLSTSYQRVSGAQLHYLDMILIGGRGSIRGYRESYVPVQEWLGLSWEVRSYTSRQGSYWGAFWDGGKIVKRWGGFHYLPQPMVSGGLTFSFTDADRTFTLDLAWARGESLRNMRIHLFFATGW